MEQSGEHFIDELSPEPDEFVAPFVAGFDQPGLAQHLEMMGEILLAGHIEKIEWAALVMLRKCPDDFEASWVAKRGENSIDRDVRTFGIPELTLSERFDRLARFLG
jgi:hypothetical protein